MVIKCDRAEMCVSTNEMIIGIALTEKVSDRDRRSVDP